MLTAPLLLLLLLRVLLDSLTPVRAGSAADEELFTRGGRRASLYEAPFRHHPTVLRRREPQ
jgi:hypothetical protein